MLLARQSKPPSKQARTQTQTCIELHGHTVISLMRVWGGPVSQIYHLHLAKHGPWKKRFHGTLFGRWHSLRRLTDGGEILIKVVHAAFNSCWAWPLCASVWARACEYVYCGAMSSKLVHRDATVTCLSLSCKNAAVPDMTATALEGPLLGVEHFLGNGMKNYNAGCAILIATQSP